MKRTFCLDSVDEGGQGVSKEPNSESHDTMPFSLDVELKSRSRTPPALNSVSVVRSRVVSQTRVTRKAASPDSESEVSTTRMTTTLERPGRVQREPQRNI